MNKNKKKITIIISIIIFIIIIISVFLYLHFFLKNKESLKEDNLLIVAQKRFNNYEYKDSFKDYLIVVKNNKLGVIDKNENLIIDFIYEENSNISIQNNSLLINSNDNYYLYDQDLKLITKSNDYIRILTDISDNKNYYYLDNKLYNFNNEEIYDIESDYFEKVGNYLFTDKYIINIKDNTKIKITFFILENKLIYALSEDEKILYTYDLNNNILNNYQVLKLYPNGYSVKDKNNNKYSFTSNYGLISQTSKIKVLDYNFNYNDCEYGFKIYDNNNKLIDNSCYERYTIYKDSNGIILNKEDNTYILYNNKITNNYNENYITGNYIVNYNQENGLVDLKKIDGKLVENNNCYLSFDYLNNGNYYCNDGAYTYIVDDELNKITKEYDEIICIPDSSYCIISKNNKYGLLMNNKILIEPKYKNIELSFDKTKIILESLWSFDVFYLEKSQNYLTKDELNKDFYKPYESLDTNKLIEEYKLENIKNIILENEELFKKYAYIVLNNNNLEKYKDKVINAFYEVILNKQYLDEDYFLESLKKLKINKKEKLDEEGYVGLYYDDDKRIDLLSEEDNVIYHEITHFIDFSFTRDSSSNIYKCQNKYISNSEFNKLNVKEANNCELVFMDDANFIVEGGAEYYSGHYLNNNVLRTYQIQTNIIGALSYLFGYDTLNEIFFDGTNGNYKLFMLFNNANINIEDYKHFLEITHRFYAITAHDLVFISDILINLYESINDTIWYEDNEFKEIISILIVGYNVSKEDSNRYNEYQNLNFDFYSKYENILDKNDLYFANLPGSYMKTDDGSYLIFSLYDDEYNNYYEIVKYDFKNNIVLNKKEIKA